MPGKTTYTPKKAPNGQQWQAKQKPAKSVAEDVDLEEKEEEVQPKAKKAPEKKKRINASGIEYNEYQAHGTLGRDPEMFYSASGTAYTKFSIAIWQGSKENDPPDYWLNCIAFNELAEEIAERYGPGDKLAVRGKMTFKPYKSRDGIDKVFVQCMVNECKDVTYHK